MTTSNNSSTTHTRLEPSKTLNRHYVQRPQPVKYVANEIPVNPNITTSSQIHSEALRRRQAIAEQINREHLAQLRKQQLEKTAAQNTPEAAKQTTINVKTTPKAIVNKPATVTPNPISTAQRATSQSIQQQAYQAQVQAQQPQQPSESILASVAQENLKREQDAKKNAKKTKKLKESGRGRRFALALAASTACVVLLGIAVKINMPDLSVQVTALQSGIDAKYPSYLPADFQLSGVSSEKGGNVIMEFSGPSKTSFTLSEEKSSWDSNALLNNFVKYQWKDDYSVVREQGITIYISGSDATWVNGGLHYTLSASAANTLTKKQIKSIVTSL